MCSTQSPRRDRRPAIWDALKLRLGPTLRAVDLARAELADDPTVDITTSGLPRRIEIWMLDIDGRFFITGTPGRRDRLANLKANSNLLVHLKRHGHVDLVARAAEVDDMATRRDVLEHMNATWYRSQESLDVLIDSAPMVEVVIDGPVG
jgi:hypothetical protein